VCFSPLKTPENRGLYAGGPIHRGFISDGWDVKKLAPSAVVLAVAGVFAVAVAFVVVWQGPKARSIFSLGRRPR